MGHVPIRDLDDALLMDYQRAADGNGRSLEAELREALAQSRPKVKLDPEGLAQRVQRLWAMTPPEAAAIDSMPAIREARDTR